MRIAPVFAVVALLPMIAFGAAQSGNWSLESTDQPGSVEFSLQSSQAGSHFSTSSTWKLADLRGLDWAATAKHDVSFSIVRDAGTIDCKGFVQDQSGAGLFTFQPNPQYRPEMAKLGFDFQDRELFSAAVFDVSFEFVRALKSAAVRGLDAGKLLAFRIHGVTPQFVHDLRAAGLEAADAGKLIAFRIHGVTPEFVNELHNAGIKTTDEDKLIAFRIHGVSAQFAGEISRLGFPQAPPDQLIALRIHGVTPEYIEGLRSKGIQNLTLEQLINLRIHGID
ncbi:MAG TPA: hypothetical protein VGI32_14720 [Steroidobacteraceae bacterium]|jgi:hypothetical protein